MRRSPLAVARIAAIAAAGALVLAACSSAASDGAGPATATTSTTKAAATATSTTVAPEPSRGCGRDAPVPEVGADRPGDVAQTMTADGVERTYRLAVPRGYDPSRPVPLIVNLHGAGSTALHASAYSQLPQEASMRGMAVVAPDAIGGKWQLAPTGTDARFLHDLVDRIEGQLCVDQQRIHLIGMSLGAWKAAATACAEGARYASVALVTVEVFPGTCPPMPMVAFHGTADPVVAYGAGGGTVDDANTPNAGVTGALSNVAAWAANGGCDPTPKQTRIGDDVVLRRYRGCDPGVDVALYTIEGGGHTWPGADIDIAAPELTTHTIDATQIALDWFEAHPKRG